MQKQSLPEHFRYVEGRVYVQLADYDRERPLGLVVVAGGVLVDYFGPLPPKVVETWGSHAMGAM